MRPDTGAVPVSGRSGYVDLAVGRYHYRRWRADGPGVVLVHGNGNTWSSWSRVAPVLWAAGHDVYALDLRGNGGSVRTPVGSYGLPELAGDLHDFIEALRIPAPAVVGHCWGAAVALTLATGACGGRVPPALDRLVLEELPADMASTARQPVVRDYMRMMRGPREYAERWVDLVCHRWHPVDRESLVDNATGADLAVYLSAIDDGAASGPLLPLLARLTVPTLLLRGNRRRGSILTDADWQRVRRYLPANCRSHELADSGHEIHRADHPTFMRLVGEFLRPAGSG